MDEPRPIRRIQRQPLSAPRTNTSESIPQHGSSAWERWVEPRLRSAPPWLASLLFHGLLLFLLALLFWVPAPTTPSLFGGMHGEFQHGESQDNLTRVADAATLEEIDTKELMGTADGATVAFDPPRFVPETTRSAEALAVPRLAANAAGPNLRVDLTRNVEVGSKSGMQVENLVIPFSGRRGAVKESLLRSEGGTPESERAVAAGLEWLSRHQFPDGRWRLDCHEMCKGEGCRPEPAMETDTAATGLALLPFLGAGHSPNQAGRYRAQVERGLEWLITHQKPNGDLHVGGEFNSWLYSHAIGTMALCEAYGLTQAKNLREPAQRAVNFIAAAQNSSNGGWRYSPGMLGDTSVFGWQILALRSARLAGLVVPKDSITKAKRYLDLAAADKSRTSYAYQPGMRATPVMTAEALLTRQYLGWPRDFPALLKGVDLVFTHLINSQERNIYYWYYATQLLHNMQGPAWKQWNTQVRDTLVAMQVTLPGCERGSWDPLEPVPDRRARAGRHYLTCLSLLSLEVYYRYLPLYRQDSTSFETDARAASTPEFEPDDVRGNRPDPETGRSRQLPNPPADD